MGSGVRRYHDLMHAITSHGSGRPYLTYLTYLTYPSYPSYLSYLLDPLQDPLQQRHELRAHAARRLDHFLFGQRLRKHARGHVRDARDAKHVDAHMPRGDRFGDGGHADGVGAERAERADLRRRLVARTSDGDVDAM